MPSAKTFVIVAVAAVSFGVAAQPNVTIWQPAVVSTAAPEFAITFTPDAREAYFNRATADRRSFPIYVSRLIKERWSAPELAPFSQDGRDPDPFVTPDGKRLYFSSTRPKRSGEGMSDLDIWYVERRGNGWTSPVNVGPPVNTPAAEVFASTTRGGTLYFGSDRDGTSAIYAARRAGGRFLAPDRLPDVINGPEGASNPLISPDERWLVFTATRPDGRGQSDLHVSERRPAGWTTPRNLATINSPYADFAPALSADGRRLFFTSERPGIVDATAGTRPPGDIYSVDISVLAIDRR